VKIIQIKQTLQNHHTSFKTRVQLARMQILTNYINKVVIVRYKHTFATLIKCAKTSALNRVLLADKISFWTRKFSWNTTSRAFNIFQYQ